MLDYLEIRNDKPFEGRMEKDVSFLPLTILHEKSAAAFLLLLIVTTLRNPGNRNETNVFDINILFYFTSKMENC